MKSRLLAVLIFSLAAFSARAQFHFDRYDSIPVYSNSLLLRFPWAGGINFAQFSEIDLDLDGRNDLFVFDRSGNKITTYINRGTAGQVDYDIAPEYVKLFPLLHDWALLRDYNCDGKMDIFTASSTLNPGIAIWKNISTVSGGLQFQLVINSIQSDVTPNSTHQVQGIYVSLNDIPAVRDVDNDGDIDVLTFDGAGTTIEWHRNMSVENFGVCDSTNVYRLETSCWGEVSESSMNSTLNLNQNCPPPPIIGNDDASSVQRNRHNGSCLECINTDGDDDQDLLIGDLYSVHISYARNGGSAGFAQMDQIDPMYPSYDQALDLDMFICGFHLDVDNDGARDVLVSPNAMNVSENYKSVWYYHNSGADDSVRSVFVKTNFLQDDMIETGEGAYPRFFDYDNDGDADLLIGNYGYYNSSGPAISEIALYKNIGSVNSPTYALLTDDFAGLHADALNISCPVPTFGDLDGDGDADMIVGDAIGKLHYFRKDPGPADNFVLVQSNYFGIDVGSYATPQLVDVDRDGLLDLIIGKQTATLSYFRNTGTAGAPNFALMNAVWGNVVVKIPSFSTGYSVPYLWDNNGNYTLLVGSERGYLYRYDNIDGNLAGNFTLTDSMYVSSHEGLRIAPWLADLNNDSLPELVLGNYAGGVSLFRGDNSVGLAENQNEIPFFSLYPNPANEQVTIQSTLPASEFPGTMILHSLTGQEIMRKEMKAANETISVSDLPAGIYLLSLQTKHGKVAYRKLMVL